MAQNKDLDTKRHNVETDDIENPSVKTPEDVDPNIMAALRRKEEEQKIKDAERNKWIKRGAMVLLAIIAILTLIFSLRSCGKNNKVDDPEHVHKYVEQVIPVTDTEDGYTIYTCEECGESYIDNFVDAPNDNDEEREQETEESETPSETEKTPDSTEKTDKETSSKPTTSTDKEEEKPTTSKPTTPTTPTNPSNPTKPTTPATKPTQPETKPTTPSTPSTPTTQPETKPTEPPTKEEEKPTETTPTVPPTVETKCPHETTSYSGCRWNISGCSCSHKHVVNKVGSYTHIYCEDEVVSHRDGKTIWYPWQYYTSSSSTDTSSVMMSTGPSTTSSETTSTKPSASQSTSSTTASKETTTEPTTSVKPESKPEEVTGCTATHPAADCRYTVCDCEHKHVEQQVGNRTYVYCEDITTAYREGKTNYYPWKYYVE